ncbi:MAG: anti-sigma factor family protein [Blastocatellia bacterium]
MTCREFSLMYSAQVDGHAGEAGQIAIHRHLRECEECRLRAAGIRQLRAELGALARPRPEAGLDGQIRLALRNEAALLARKVEKHADRMAAWRMRLFSQTIGTAVSLCLFFVVITGVFKPAYRALALASAAQEVIFEETNQDAIKLKVLLLQPPPPPIFQPNRELLGIGAKLSEDEEIIATVRVMKDGRASINQIVAPLSDPSVTARFSNVIMHRASFQPTSPARNISPDAVVILSSVSVTARASI